MILYELKYKINGKYYKSFVNGPSLPIRPYIYMAVSEIDRKTLKSHDYNPLMVVFMQHIITGISVSSLVISVFYVFTTSLSV
jgi:hypothetical protein